jgi:hypothetical protein
MYFGNFLIMQNKLLIKFLPGKYETLLFIAAGNLHCRAGRLKTASGGLTN